MKRILLSIVSVAMATAMMAQSFDHEVTQPAPGGNTAEDRSECRMLHLWLAFRLCGSTMG